MDENNPFSLEQVSVRLVKAPPLYSDTPISEPEDAVKLLAGELQGYDREVMAVVNLDVRNKPINFSIVSIGALNATLANPRDMLKNIFLSNASGTIILHNHPSGDPNPSKEDIVLTDRFMKTCELVSINLVDHIIIAGGGEKNVSCYSFRQNEILPTSSIRFATDVTQLQRRWRALMPQEHQSPPQKKYELTDETKTITMDGQEYTLHRIRALKDFSNANYPGDGKIHAGDLGGWVESEYNLSQEGNCWVKDDACVWNFGQIKENACISDNVYVFGESIVTNQAFLKDNVRIFDHAAIAGKAFICQNSLVFGAAEVLGHSIIQDYSSVSQHATISGGHIVDYAHIGGFVSVEKDVYIGGNAHFEKYEYLSGKECYCGSYPTPPDLARLGYKRMDGDLQVKPQHKVPAHHR